MDHQLTDAQLEAFFVDATVDRLRAIARETDALAIAYPREIHISNFLAWLFSPGEGHGLSDLPLRALLRAAWQSATPRQQASMAAFAPSKLGLLSLGAALCIREYGGELGRYDLLIVDPACKLIVLLENKYGAAQGKEQLSRYRKAMERQMKDADGWTQLLIFMDTNPASNAESSGWIKVDYQWVVDLIDEQVARKHVNAESLQVLRMFRPYVADASELPFVALDDCDDQILHVAEQHEAVLDAMKQYRQLSWRETVVEMTSPQPAPLLVEYQQRYRLWDFVIDASAWIVFTRPFAHELDDVQFDAKVKSLYIFREAWEAHWQPQEKKKHWPGWVKVYQSGDRGTQFSVEAVIYTNVLAEPAKAGIFDRAKEVRKRHGLRAVGETVDRVVLKAATGLSRQAALKEALQMRLLLDEVLVTPSITAHPGATHGVQPVLPALAHQVR